MESLSHPFTILFIIIWVIEFYLYGMQRASLMISRHNNVKWRGTGEQLLPNWYPITWLIRFLKYGLLIIILITLGWKLSIALLVLGFIMATVIPIPYRTLYKNIFRKKVNKIRAIDQEAGQFFTEMLNKTNF